MFVCQIVQHIDCFHCFDVGLGDWQSW